VTEDLTSPDTSSFAFLIGDWEGEGVAGAPGVDDFAFAQETPTGSGTFVAGSIGLMKSYAREQGTTLTNDEITTIIKQTSDKVDSRLRNERAGYGLINLADAFKLLSHSADRGT